MLPREKSGGEKRKKKERVGSVFEEAEKKGREGAQTNSASLKPRLRCLPKENSNPREIKGGFWRSQFLCFEELKETVKEALKEALSELTTMGLLSKAIIKVEFMAGTSKNVVLVKPRGSRNVLSHRHINNQEACGRVGFCPTLATHCCFTFWQLMEPFGTLLLTHWGDRQKWVGTPGPPFNLLLYDFRKLTYLLWIYFFYHKMRIRHKSIVWKKPDQKST